ncbi:hypothetical protein [Nostoc sp. DedQUE09]|uniref:hypothetical protein n=1 Tax=Nostoc sp. DedQUE09 TaxID=3075394 RepID=UPI002AD27F2B|nr:hypothetical protein [Nostoc sp. DedQUE09]MDZ7952279.1 hypothetical protein [Nostoc sp. DedQUE09]
MFVKVLVMLHGSKPEHYELHEFTRVPSIGEKISFSTPQGRYLYFVVTDVIHHSLHPLRGEAPQARIIVKPV